MSIETEEELEGLRRAGRVVAEALRELRRRVQPGVRTDDLDRVAGRVFARHGARSAPKLVYGAPSEVFISVNDAAVHGVPGPQPSSTASTPTPASPWRAVRLRPPPAGSSPRPTPRVCTPAW